MPGNPARNLCVDGRMIDINIILNGIWDCICLIENIDGWQSLVDEMSGGLKARNCLTS